MQLQKWNRFCINKGNWNQWLFDDSANLLRHLHVSTLFTQKESYMADTFYLYKYVTRDYIYMRMNFSLLSISSAFISFIFSCTCTLGIHPSHIVWSISSNHCFRLYSQFSYDFPMGDNSWAVPWCALLHSLSDIRHSVCLTDHYFFNALTRKYSYSKPTSIINVDSNNMTG